MRLKSFNPLSVEVSSIIIQKAKGVVNSLAEEKH